MDYQAKVIIAAFLAALGAVPAAPGSAIAAAVARGTIAAGMGGELAPGVHAEVLRALGWVYYPSRPRSRQAHAHNYDGRTTWTTPYWYNTKTGRVSTAAPAPRNRYLGDNLWRRDPLDRWRIGGAALRLRPGPLERMCAVGRVQPRLW
jgi:hypothetical protein